MFTILGVHWQSVRQPIVKDVKDTHNCLFPIAGYRQSKMRCTCFIFYVQPYGFYHIIHSKCKVIEGQITYYKSYTTIIFLWFKKD